MSVAWYPLGDFLKRDRMGTCLIVINTQTMKESDFLAIFQQQNVIFMWVFTLVNENDMENKETDVINHRLYPAYAILGQNLTEIDRKTDQSVIWYLYFECELQIDINTLKDCWHQRHCNNLIKICLIYYFWTILSDIFACLIMFPKLGGKKRTSEIYNHCV